MKENMIHCIKLNKKTESMSNQPFPGELGEKIQKNISAEAWQMWLKQQTMLINEYRLNTLDPKAREFLTEQMQKFLFADEDVKPEGYKEE